MKKWLALALALVMLFAMVACDKGESSEPKEEEPINISRGTISGNVYTNESIGFEFVKPDSWTYSSDAEIAALVNLSVDRIFGDNFKDALKNSPAVFDMMVVDPETRSNVQVGYENLSKTLHSDATVDEYINALEMQLSSASGMTVTFPETFDTVKLGNVEFTRGVCRTTMYGVSMTQVYYLKKIDGFMCYVITTIPDGYTYQQIEAMFK